VKPPPDARWHAGADGEGHALLVGRRHTRALCGSPRHDERFDHPLVGKCRSCITELDRLTNAALMSEGERRFAWGDR
jgi:hypothetical protein